MYRPDVDGLRALAIAVVVVFHVAPSTLPGGFVGVDVFFVISGYLITQQILDEQQRDRFSIVSFYARRIRRLFPALALVIAATLVAAFFVLTPNEYITLSTRDAAGSAFYANIQIYLPSCLAVVGRDGCSPAVE